MKIFTDGGSRGNPGPAAIGVYIENDHGERLAEIGQTIGIATNNVAEYKAIIAALEWALSNSQKIATEKTITFYVDSQLAYSQITGLYRIKNTTLREFIFAIREMEEKIRQEIRYFHIPRELNKKADALVNKALDER